MCSASLAVLFLLAQAEEPVAPLEQAGQALNRMREQLRAIEHGLQEAKDLGDGRAFDCVKAQQPQVGHQIESAEQWEALLKEAVQSGAEESTGRLLRHILDSEKQVQRILAQVGNCRLTVQPPEPVPQRSWFGCGTDAACERRATTATTFGLGSLLVVTPAAMALALNRVGTPVENFGALGLEAAAGGLIGGLALLAVTGGLTLAITQDLRLEDTAAGPLVGLGTALGIGAGSLVAMGLERPGAGAPPVVAAAVAHLALVGISTLLIALHSHLRNTDGGESSLAAQGFAFAPVLMTLATLFTVPATWLLFERR